MALVAISSPYGAGGSRVAPALAERLKVPFLDRPAGTEPEQEDRGGGGLLSKLGSIGLAWGTPIGMELEDLVPGDARRREIEAELSALQATGGGVVLGRAAAVLLRDDPRVLRVLLTGPPERRIEQAMAIEGIERDTAARRLERTDRARLAYHQTLYCVDPRSPELYHLIVDTTAIPLETVVDLLAAAVDG
jgi:cytidylate kinase